MSAVMAVGWVGAVLGILSAVMPTMIPLRGFGAASNIGWILFGGMIGSWPTMAQHITLLPLNLYRLWQMKKLIRETQGAAEAGISTDWLVPFSKSDPRKAGEVLFHKGDAGDRLYYLRKGRVRFEEFGIEISDGALFGELAFFLEDGSRTQTARCVTDCDLLSISERQLKQLYFQNPKFGWFLVRLIAQRLSENLVRVRAQIDTSKTAG